MTNINQKRKESPVKLKTLTLTEKEVETIKYALIEYYHFLLENSKENVLIAKVLKNSFEEYHALM